MRIGYARVSTRHQADTEALDQQINRLEKAGAEKILYDIESGRKDTRKNFNQLINLAKNGVATEIIVTRLDRLGRNVISIHRTIDALQKVGVKLTILDSPLGNTNSAFGWLTINNIAGLAEFESRLLSERVSFGTEYFRSNLKYFGKAPFGYTKDENSKCIPHPSNWAIAKEIIDRLYENSFTSLSRWLVEQYSIKMYPTSILKWLHNPALRGHTFYKLKTGETEKHYGTHEALITEQQYEELSKLTSFLHKKDPAKFKTHFLAGLFRCGICAAGMSKTGADSKESNNSLRFQCIKYKKFGKSVCDNSKQISASIVKRRTIGELVKFAESILDAVNTSTIAIQTETSEELLSLKHQLATLQTLPKNDLINSTIAETEYQIKIHEQQKNVRESRTEEDIYILEALNQADFFEELSDSELRAICLRFIESVKYNGGKEFVFAFHSRLLLP
jgi:site-specific DNA recombinase